MSEITVWSPLGINRVEARPITPRLASLDGVTLGLLKLRAMYKTTNWPDWVNPDDDEALCPIVGTPEDIHLVVTGGPGKHSAFIPTFGTSKSVTRTIEGDGATEGTPGQPANRRV
jgi:hypothetical protein